MQHVVVWVAIDNSEHLNKKFLIIKRWVVVCGLPGISEKY